MSKSDVKMVYSTFLNFKNYNLQYKTTTFVSLTKILL